MGPLFRKVSIGKDYSKVSYLVGSGNLRRTYDVIGSETYVYDDNFIGGFFVIRCTNPSSSPGWESAVQSFYFEYKFVLNESTHLVESKEEGFFSLVPNNYHGPCLKPVIYFYPT